MGFRVGVGMWFGVGCVIGFGVGCLELWKSHSFTLAYVRHDILQDLGCG